MEISPEYQNKKTNLSKEEKKRISALVKKAKAFLSVLSFRNQTILKVLTAIVNYQQDFFIGRNCAGEKQRGYLRALKQADIAEITGLNISTISRAASGKYIRCEWGVFEIKELFSAELTGGISADFAKEKIQEIIRSSQEKLSDEKIKEVLKTQGIAISTRTVNKYRHEFKIPSSYKR